MRSQLLQYQSVMIYLSQSDEVDTTQLRDFLQSHGRTVLIPYAQGGAIEAVELSQEDVLSNGVRDIPTLLDKNFRSDRIDCIICPGRQFTRDGKRKGRGGGWYDRFLAKHPESYKIGLCRQDQIVEYLEQKDWDIKMDKIIII